MNLFWATVGMFGVIKLAATLAEYFKHEFNAVTIIGNCLIPVLAVFMVCLLNEMQRLIRNISESSDDDH